MSERKPVYLLFEHVTISSVKILEQWFPTRVQRQNRVSRKGATGAANYHISMNNRRNLTPRGAAPLNTNIT